MADRTNAAPRVSHRVLVVEDDQLLRRGLVRQLIREGCEVAEAADGQAAAEELERGFAAELIISDLEMPRSGGRDVLALGLKRQVPVVILTGHGSVELAVDLMRQGAANFLTKPFSPENLRGVLDEAFGRKTTSRSVQAAPRLTEMLVGQAVGFLQVLDTVETVAETDATVLITGESGTGKELVARMIHAASRRAAKPFVAVNCGGQPDTLLESELFGHTRRAFTGATHARAGRFQLADRGTVFLDEVGDMPASFQVKLLRVLQEGQFEVLGESVTRTVDVRVIAATHRDLTAMVAEGTFREDLFYRLNVIDLKLPPLRDRREDIPLLVTHLIAAANTRHGRNVAGAAQEVVAAFAGYRWPGNIRELSNVVERMVVLKRQGELDVNDLPAAFQGTPAANARVVELPAHGIDLRQAVTEFEYALIEQALTRTGGNRNAAAQLLGLNRTTLVEKLRRKPSAESGEPEKG